LTWRIWEKHSREPAQVCGRLFINQWAHFKGFGHPQGLSIWRKILLNPSESEETDDVGGKITVMSSLCLYLVFTGVKFPLDCLLLCGRKASPAGANSQEAPTLSRV